MSTTIYDGFKFKTMDLMKIHRCIAGFRKELQILVAEKVVVLIARRSEQLIDRLALGNLKSLNKDSCPFSQAYISILDDLRGIRRTHERNPEVDFSFELSILPLKNKILGIPYTECRDFLELWFKKPIVEPYGYWDNTDSDEDCTEKEWRQRARDWRRALPGLGVPCMNGFTATCVDCACGYYIPEKEEVLKRIRSIEERAEIHAGNMLIDEAVNEKVDFNVKDIRQAIGEAWPIMQETKKWLKTDEGKKVLKKRISEVTAILPTITLELLLTGDEQQFHGENRWRKEPKNESNK